MDTMATTPNTEGVTMTTTATAEITFVNVKGRNGYRTNVPQPRNGATVLVAHRNVGKTEDYIVLCEWHNGAEFVVWRMDLQGNCYWGDYYATYSAAEDAFIKR